ncbi:hypothetical protein SK128_019399 [Halocaridina rubra]|uniref:Nuclear receptor domain-containing protein n=1 Tax=Halocaridina rubra TaxID=373956 RepID=A0AAN9A8F7_HALRR
MAQVPAFYYEDFMEPQQPSTDAYSIFHDPFMSTYQSNPPVSNYSPSHYQQGYSNGITTQPNQGGCQSHFSGQYQCLPMANGSGGLNTAGDSLYRNETLNSMRTNSQMNSKMSNHFVNKYSSEELDEPLDELPLESLLHITHQEGQLIKESEVDDIGNPVSSQMRVNMSRTSNQNGSCYSTNSRNLYLNGDGDEDDSGSCISSSTLYSVNSPTGAMNSATSLCHDFDLSNHSPTTTSNTVSTPLSPNGESRAFTEPVTPSQPFTSHSNAASPNSSSSYTNPNCNISNNNYFSSSHIPSSPEQMGSFKPFSPDHTQSENAFDYVRDFKDKYPKEAPNSGTKQNHIHNPTKKGKIAKKNTKSAQAVGNRPKKSKIKESPNPDSPEPCQVEGNSSSDDSARVSDEGSRKYLKKAGSSGGYGSKNGLVAPVSGQSEPEKAVPPRKRMRCPRGMQLEKKPCNVCGDTAKNMHFGGLVCDSCKAFFRRSVQSNTWDTFKCEKDGNCVITKSNRRACQYCRYQKCESVGMLKEWVMTESGRMRLMKNRLAKTRHIHEEKEKDKIYGDLPRGLDHKDAIAINTILETMHETFGMMPFPKECAGDSIDALSNIFVYLCKRFGQFFLRITETTDLCQEDKTLLLKNGIAMSLYITGAHMYDPVTQSWPAESTHPSVMVPKVTLETLQKLANIPDAFSTIMKFYKNYEGDLKDHMVAALMYLISFFLSDDPNFVDIPRIQRVQDQYTGYLKRYLIARDGYQSVTGIFLKLMDGLSYVKDILKYHTIVDIKPTIDHKDLMLGNNSTMTQCMTNLIHQIQESLKGNFPPYASVLNENEKQKLALISSPSNSLVLSTRRPGPIMQNHPDTVAIFGSNTCTDVLITQPLQNMINWQKVKEETDPATDSFSDLMDVNGFPDLDSSSFVVPSFENYNQDYIKDTNVSSSSKHLSMRNGKVDGTGSSEVDVDAVCDILKRLSHTDDHKVISILKENIPKELLEKFSRTLSDDEM